MALNYSGAAGGVLSGASTGAMFGPYGAAIGGVAGGLLGLFSGGKKKKKKMSTLDKKQKQLYGDVNQGLYGEGPFKDLYNWDAEGYNNVFDQTVQRPALRNFQENIIPQITGQFRGNNLMNSSYTGEALSRAGRNVQENLDAERARMQFEGSQQARAAKQNQINNIINANTQAMQRPQSQNPGMIDQLLNGLSGSAGDYLADYLNKTRNASSNTQTYKSAGTGSGGGGIGYSMDIMNQFSGGTR
jgi:hypothetical protein